MASIGNFVLILIVLFYEVASHGSWYSEHGGPSNWPQIYKGCGGKRQSPINLPSANTVKIKRNFPALNRSPHFMKVPKKIIIKNLGHAVQILPFYANDERCELSGGPLNKTFLMDHVHFHWGEANNAGTEHTINGKKYAMEAHVVFYDPKYGDLLTASTKPDGAVVTAYLFKVDTKALSPAMDSLTNALALIEGKNVTELLVPTPFAFGNLFIPFQEDYLTYLGSMTTPPCSESVQWIVYDIPLGVSPANIAIFRALYEICPEIRNNFRPIQELNGREVIGKTCC